jgi:hypothetical protein
LTKSSKLAASDQKNIVAKYLILNAILLADEQVIVASGEDELQRAACALNNMAAKYNFGIAVNKTKAMAMKEKMNVRTKIVINNNIIEQANRFNYLGYIITVSKNRDLEIQNRFNQICNTIGKKLSNKTRKETDKIL